MTLRENEKQFDRIPSQSMLVVRCEVYHLIDEKANRPTRLETPLPGMGIWFAQSLEADFGASATEMMRSLTKFGRDQSFPEIKPDFQRSFRLSKLVLALSD
jgi:hypothetical protein